MAAKDSQFYYGSVSRLLHWVMAALLLWQFTGMILKELLGRTALTGFWGGTHGSVGMLLLALFIVRAVWAFANRAHRPGYRPDLLGKCAALGHFALYALMFIVPSLALLRAFGSGKGVTFFGLQLQAPTGVKTDWMTAPGNALHGNLAWLFLALILGHVLMVIVHRVWLHENILERMLGKRNTQTNATLH
ncbi:putative cytochrome b561 [Caenibius tardaugens NBRC 16725]|uniref:Putative cytochrome b561 n=1 Tax=Caenibius tardaugens NBRC 16725 TaxID=1219035 RepID=U2YP15_9SPHN|nr:cytochrome b [Caenibius tardaugens]AZI35147.1 cytochrome b [Caenibius tardaugens NBRC 16725]GAD50342.1 putative cytochrome b561 [Caenibius tardaugens NBRC 16725]